MSKKTPAEQEAHDVEEEKYSNKMGIVLNEKYIGWHGSTPFVEFDENFVQMPLTRTELKIPREHTTRMTYLAWFAGFIAGQRGEQGLKMFLIIILFLSIGGLILSFYLNSATQESLKAMGTQLAQTLGELNVIKAGLNITANTTVV